MVGLQLVDVDDVKTGRGGRSGGGKKGGKSTYSAYGKAIESYIPFLMESIAKSKDGVIRVKTSEIAKQMDNGRMGNFSKKNPTTIYWGLKYSLYGVGKDKGIVVMTGKHNDGSPVLVMREREKGDVLPDSLLKKIEKDVGKDVKVSEPDIDKGHKEYSEEDEDIEDDEDNKEE